MMKGSKGCNILAYMSGPSIEITLARWMWHGEYGNVEKQWDCEIKSGFGLQKKYDVIYITGIEKFILKWSRSLNL